MLAMNNRKNSFGIIPFFLTRGYHLEPIQRVERPGGGKPSEPTKRAEAFVNRLAEGQEYAQAAMASVQQRMEESVNQRRKEAEVFRVRDKVWLNLKNVGLPNSQRNWHESTHLTE